MSRFDNTRMCIGIDLGTTNTTVAISRTNTRGDIVVEDAEIHQVGSNRPSVTLPSILFVKDGKEYVGNRALDLKEHYIKESSGNPPYLENTKRYIGTQKKFEIGNKEYTAIDVAAKILETVKSDPKIKRIPDAYVCITVPANFNTDQRNNTKEAAKRAGFFDVELREEPKAAILSFLHEENEKRELKQLDVTTKKEILVIDIGGGTCDICVEVVEKNNLGGYNFLSLAEGRDNLGGADFDVRIALYLMKKYDIDILNLSDSVRAQMQYIGQMFKETLSRNIDDYIYDEYDGIQQDFIQSPTWKQELEDVLPVSSSHTINGRMIEFELSAVEFFEVISPLVYHSEADIRNKDEREEYKNMEDLVRKTLLKAAMQEVFGKQIVSPDKPLLAVSRGASLMNKYESEDSGMTERMSRSIMIETISGRFKQLISAGEVVPVSRTVEETFKTTSRNGVVIRLFEGKDEFDNQLRKLNNVYTIEFPSVCELNREFQIKYSVDRTKQLKFEITFLDDKSTYIIEAQVREDRNSNVAYKE